MKTPEQLKGTIRSMATKKNLRAQEVLQMFLFERILDRLANSDYQKNFILKGGLLISSMIGIGERTTMDMDTTIKGLPLTKDNITNIMDEICNIEIDDNVTLKINKVELIREDDDYGGYRITFEAKYNNEMPVIMKIDITTGDKITYKEIEYSFTLMLEDRKIQIWSYNVETIIAEKFEAIVKRGVLSTRIRDYYDVYMLINTQNKIIDKKTLKDAITLTAQHRGTNEIIKDWKKIVEKIANDSKMRQQWKRYQKDNFYAEEIEYKDLINAISKVGEIFDN